MSRAAAGRRDRAALSAYVVDDHLLDGSRQRVAVAVARHQVIFGGGAGFVGIGVEDEVVVAFAGVDEHVVPLQAGRRRAIHADDDRLSGVERGVDGGERRVGRFAEDVGLEADLRVDLVDDLPADHGADESARGLHFVVEGLGCVVIAEAFEQHGDAGEGASHIADGVAGIAEAEDLFFPLRVLLGVVRELV